jgi:hypothetical protein
MINNHVLISIMDIKKTKIVAAKYEIVINQYCRFYWIKISDAIHYNI